MTLKLALFDLDNTLLEGDSDHGWSEFLIQQGLLNGEEIRHANDRFYADYCQGRLNMDDYLAFNLRPLTIHPREAMFAHRERYVTEVVAQKFRPQGLAQIRHHQSLGHTLILITATNEFVTTPIAQSLGFPTLIATQIEEINGQWTGRGRGIPSFGEGKVTRLEEWLSLQGTRLEQCESWFYSDSMNDYPLLARVNHPVVVSPDQRLREKAAIHDWPIVDWSFPSGINAPHHHKGGI